MLKFSDIILKHRKLNIILLSLITIIMCFFAYPPKFAYKMAQLLPEQNEVNIQFQEYIDEFGENNTIVIAVQDSSFFQRENLLHWHFLTNEIELLKKKKYAFLDDNNHVNSAHGIESVLSITNAYILQKEDTVYFKKTLNEEDFQINNSVHFKNFDSLSELEIRKLIDNKAIIVDSTFIYRPVLWYSPKYNQNELDSASEEFNRHMIYKDMLFRQESNSAIMIIQLNDTIVANKSREKVVKDIERLGAQYENVINLQNASKNIDLKYSGLPYLRIKYSQDVKKEVSFFIILTLISTLIILFIFFRSIQPTLISMVVVILGVIYSFGITGILQNLFNGYEINALTALIPPVIIVIGIPNCIFLINKYHTEYKKSMDKILSIKIMTNKIGNITLLTNLTTAAGFAAFTLTDSTSLQEFGLVAALSILTIYVISLVTIPIFFSFIQDPKVNQVKHLDKKWINKCIDVLSKWVLSNRRSVYLFTFMISAAGIIGMLMIKTTGNITDDISREGDLYKDLQFFEDNFSGVMPVEIIIQPKDTTGVFLNKSFMRKVDILQDSLIDFHNKVFSKPFSDIELIKYAYQIYNNSDPNFYFLPLPKNNLHDRPHNMKIGRFYDHLKTQIKENKNQESIFFKLGLHDSRSSKTRISFRMKDVESPEMDMILNNLRPIIDSTFNFTSKNDNKKDYDIHLTGSSRVFLEGTKFLAGNLVRSLSMVMLLIALFMAWMFRSYKMVLISLLPNIIPLIITAGIMGYAGIPIKPSTILVFSVAFGISVDDTIHFLAKYRQELISSNWNIRSSVFNSLKETGVSMIYTSIVLFCGFFVFVASDFGGTVALGLLVSITLFVAMLTNLVILPSLLLSLEKSITNKAFREPLIDIFDEEEDIELSELKIKNKKS